MSVTYTWKITAIRTATVQEQENFVIHVRWEKIGADEHGNTGTFIGATPFAETVDAAGNFVPFADLTEEIVLAWVQSVVVGSYEEHVNGQIALQIQAKVHAVAEPPLPWAPAPEPTPANA